MLRSALRCRGTVLAFAAVGEGPFGTGSTAALVYRVVHSPPDLDRVPAQVRPLVERCLAKDARQRPSPAELLGGLGGVGVWAGWLPAAVIEDFPQPATWLAPAADAQDPPRWPVTEAAAAPSTPGNGTGYPVTQIADRHHRPVSEYDGEHGPPGAPRAADALGQSTPVKIRRRSLPGLAMMAAIVLLAIIGYSIYHFVSTPSGVKRPDASGTTTSQPAARPSRTPTPSPTVSATPALSAVVISVAVGQEPCWVLLTRASDGSQIYMGLLPAGTTMTWAEHEAVDIRLGNPAAVVLTVNGKRQPIKTVLPTTFSFSPSPGSS